MLVFQRQQFTELWITIKSDEPLAILNTQRVEDYFGVDGQLTLRSMEDDTRIPILMSEDTTITPGISFDAYTGFVDLTTLSDGFYRVEGRIRDTIGNYRILSAVETPFGNEDVTIFELQITELSVVITASKVITLYQLPTAITTLSLTDWPEGTFTVVDSHIDTMLLLPPEKDTMLTIPEGAKTFVYLPPQVELSIINVYTIP